MNKKQNEELNKLLTDKFLDRLAHVVRIGGTDLFSNIYEVIYMVEDLHTFVGKAKPDLQQVRD